MESELVILVDNHDNEIGLIEKIEAHKKALLHRAISVFLFNSNGDWLLQRRALNKYRSGGLWTNTCCTHPLPNETNLEASSHRLRQEMGMQSKLHELFSFTYKEPLDNYKYIHYKNLDKNISINHYNYMVWFKKIVEKVQLHKLKSGAI